MQVIELQSFAPYTLWATLAENTYLYFNVYDRYEKMSFRNTYTLAGGNGPIRLSIPLVNGRNQRIPYQEVLIDNSQIWQKLQWRTIVSAYNRSPWFEFYKLELQQLFEKPFERLTDWNLAGVDWLLKQLKWKGKMEVLKAPLQNEEMQKCQSLENIFAPRNIQRLLPESVPYHQVFEQRSGFIPHCSILDLLFCEGPATAGILKKQAALNKPYLQDLSGQKR